MEIARACRVRIGVAAAHLARLRLLGLFSSHNQSGRHPHDQFCGEPRASGAHGHSPASSHSCSTERGAVPVQANGEAIGEEAAFDAVFTTRLEETDVHVVPMFHILFNRIQGYLKTLK